MHIRAARPFGKRQIAITTHPGIGHDSLTERTGQSKGLLGPPARRQPAHHRLQAAAPNTALQTSPRPYSAITAPHNGSAAQQLPIVGRLVYVPLGLVDRSQAVQHVADVGVRVQAPGQLCRSCTSSCATWRIHAPVVSSSPSWALACTYAPFFATCAGAVELRATSPSITACVWCSWRCCDVRRPETRRSAQSVLLLLRNRASRRSRHTRRALASRPRGRIGWGEWGRQGRESRQKKKRLVVDRAGPGDL